MAHAVFALQAASAHSGTMRKCGAQRCAGEKGLAPHLQHLFVGVRERRHALALCVLQVLAHAAVEREH